MSSHRREGVHFGFGADDVSVGFGVSINAGVDIGVSINAGVDIALYCV